MATTFPASPVPEDRRLLEVVGVVLVELLVSEEGEEEVAAVVLDRVVMEGDDPVGLCSVVGLGGALFGVIGAEVGVALLGCSVLFTGVSGSLVLVGAPGLAVGPDSAGTVTGACVADGTRAELLVAARPDVMADGGDEATVLPQAASSRAVMPCPATISALRRLRGEDTSPTLTSAADNPD